MKEPAVLYSASWGDDGRIVYSLGPRGLWIVSDDGGAARRLGSDTADGRSASSVLIQPHILPGGTHALVTIFNGKYVASSDSSSLGLIALTDGRVTDLGVSGAGAHFVNPGYVVFNRGPAVFAVPFSARSLTVTGSAVQLFGGVSPNGSRVVYDFTVARDGGWLAYQAGSFDVLTTMWAVDRRGRERSLTTPEPKAYANGRVSPDGRRVAVRVMGGGFGQGDLWIYEIESGAMSKLTTDGESYRPAWSRDGATLFYMNGQGDSTRVASRAWDGGGVESIHLRRPRLGEVEPGPADAFFAVRTLVPRDIYIAPADSLPSLRPFLVSAASEQSPAISPNGRWLAYLSDESGTQEAFIRPLPGPGARVPLSIGGAIEARWAHDGKSLFYRGPTHLMMASIVETPQFAVTRRDTLFADTYGRGIEMNFDVFPSGNEFLFFKAGASVSKLYMVVNWQSMLGKAGASPREP